MPLNDELAVALEDAYESGYQAAQRGDPIEDFPGPRSYVSRRAWKAWHAGYCAARSERNAWRART